MARRSQKLDGLVEIRALVGVRVERPDGRRVGLAEGRAMSVTKAVAVRVVATGRAEYVEERAALASASGGGGNDTLSGGGGNDTLSGGE